MATHNLTKLHRHQLTTAGPKTGPAAVTPRKPGHLTHNAGHSPNSCATASLAGLPATFEE